MLFVGHVQLGTECAFFMYLFLLDLCLFSTLNCITCVLSYSVLQFKIPVLLVHLLQDITPNLDIAVILCGKLFLMSCKFGFCDSFQEYVNHINGNYVYLKI
jgi:hypothetical protein